MANVKYTRIEITQEAYEALEAEAILQGKTNIVLTAIAAISLLRFTPWGEPLTRKM